MKRYLAILISFFSFLFSASSSDISSNSYGETISAEKQIVITSPDLLKSSSFELGFGQECKNSPCKLKLVFINDDKTLEAYLDIRLTPSSFPPVVEYKKRLDFSLVADHENLLKKKCDFNVDSDKSPVFIKFKFTGSNIIIEAGAKKLKNVVSFPSDFVAQSVIICADNSHELYRYDFEGIIANKNIPVEDVTYKDIWQFIDEEIDLDYSRRGGKYRLASHEDKNGNITLYYLDGANVNSAEWKRGMIKALLVPSPLAGNYDVVWYDAFLKPINSDANAYFNENILTISFPYEKATLRFVKTE